MTTTVHPRKWKVAYLAGLDYAKMDPSDVINSLRSLGYEGIEWTTEHFNPERPLSELRQLVDQTRDAGMEVSRITGHEDLVCLDDAIRQARIDKTVAVIHAAGECGIATVGTMTGPAIWEPNTPQIGVDISESAAWGQVFEAYDAFIAAAERANTVISSEGVYGMMAHDFYTHRYLMEKAASPYHKVNLDPSHGALYDDLDVGWIVREWGDNLAHVHLKDAVGVPVPRKFVFPLLGEGRVDWSSFFSALDEISYTGFCCVEFESFRYYRTVLKNDPEAAARLSLANVNALLSQ